MHPNPHFRWEDRDAMRMLVREVGFGALFAATADGPRVAHLPVVWLASDAIGVHLARGNALARHLDGAVALLSVQGPDAYVSPDWYGTGPDEVPTWNYVAVELEGRATRLDRDGLTAQIDALAREQEGRLAPKPAWTRGKADPKKIDQLLDAVVGFRLDVQAWRGTRKLGQHKPEPGRSAATAALEARGEQEIARWMRQAW